MDLSTRGIDFIRAYALPRIELWPGTLLTTDLLIETFRCSIECTMTKLASDQLDPLQSRAGGLPHMPAGTEWPKSTYLAAQLNLAEIAATGLWDFFPAEGTAYLFFNTAATDFHPFSPTACQALWCDNAAPRALQPVPSDADLPGGGVGRDNFLPESWSLELRPIFSLGFGELVPEKLIEGLQNELGIPNGDERDGDIGGRANTWQDEEEGDLFAPADWDHAADLHPLGDRFLLFQTPFGEGNAHFWIQKEALRAGTFGPLETTYSGT